jgi:hypothetical protein
MYLTSLLLAVAATASSATALDPARLMLLDASSCQFVIMQKSLSEHTAAENAKFESDRAKARADMQKELPDALKSAGDSADLKSSIQAFYTAATAYCDDPSSKNEREYNAQDNLLDKKLDAAGR